MGSFFVATSVAALELFDGNGIRTFDGLKALLPVTVFYCVVGVPVPLDLEGGRYETRIWIQHQMRLRIEWHPSSRR